MNSHKYFRLLLLIGMIDSIAISAPKDFPRILFQDPRSFVSRTQIENDPKDLAGEWDKFPSYLKHSIICYLEEDSNRVEKSKVILEKIFELEFKGEKKSEFNIKIVSDQLKEKILLEAPKKLEEMRKVQDRFREKGVSDKGINSLSFVHYSLCLYCPIGEGRESFQPISDRLVDFGNDDFIIEVRDGNGRNFQYKIHIQNKIISRIDVQPMD